MESQKPTVSATFKGGIEGDQGVQVNIRQNFSEKSETQINNLINYLMIGGYQCIAMGSYFDRDEVGLFGMAHFAKWASVELYQLVRVLSDYVVLRGGRVYVDKVMKPMKTEFKSAVEALELVLQVKEIAYEHVLEIHKSAVDECDPSLAHFVESVLLRPLVALNRQLVVLISNAKRAGTDLGEYEFNKHLEVYLQSIVRDPMLMHFAHGGVDFLNMYNPPTPTTPTSWMPVDFSSILNYVLTQAPQLRNLDLHELIHMVGFFNVGSVIRPQKIY